MTVLNYRTQKGSLVDSLLWGFSTSISFLLFISIISSDFSNATLLEGLQFQNGAFSHSLIFFFFPMLKPSYAVAKNFRIFSSNSQETCPLGPKWQIYIRFSHIYWFTPLFWPKTARPFWDATALLRVVSIFHIVLKSADISEINTPVLHLFGQIRLKWI